jgi:DNA-binding response OmpR family regulator
MNLKRNNMENLNVLILEDELIIYLHIKSTLQDFGFKNIFIAKDYDSAMLIATEQQIDILFSDIKIEGSVDGITTSKRILSLYNNNLPVIFITAFDDDITLKKLSDVSFSGYLLKPFRKEELKALIYLVVNKFNLINNNKFIEYKNYSFNKKDFILYQNNSEVKLSKKEQQLIILLFNNINVIVPYENIDSIVWKGDFVSTSTRRTFIHRFKNKFKDFNFRIEKNIGIGLF